MVQIMIHITHKCSITLVCFLSLLVTEMYNLSFLFMNLLLSEMCILFDMKQSAFVWFLGTLQLFSLALRFHGKKFADMVWHLCFGWITQIKLTWKILVVPYSLVQLKNKKVTTSTKIISTYMNFANMVVMWTNKTSYSWHLCMVKLLK